MKHIFILILVALMCQGITAQTIFEDKIDWSEGVKSKLFDPAFDPDFVGMYQGKLVTLASGGWGKVFMKEYEGSSLASSKKVELALEFEGNKLRRTDQLIFGDDLLIISNYLNKTTSKKHFFIQTYLGNGELSKPKLIASMNWENVNVLFASKDKIGETYEAYNALKVIVSEDKKSLVVMYPDGVELEDGVKAHWTAVGYDENLTETWKYEFDIENGNIYLDKVKLSNDGKLYCAGIENTIILSYNIAHYHIAQGNIIGDSYHLLIADPINKTNKLIDLGIRDSTIISYSMDLDGNEAVFYGLTGSRMNRSDATGMFVKKMSAEGEELFYTVQAFSDDLLTYNEDINPKQKGLGTNKTKEKQMRRNFILDDIRFTESGDMVFLAEQFNYYVTQTMNTSAPGSPNNSVEIDHYVYGDIIAISCTKSGDVKWMRRIVKYQHTTDDQGFYSSYYAKMKGDELHLLTNDTEYYVNYKEFKDAALSVKSKAKKNEVLSSISISATGDVDRRIHIQSENEDNYYRCAPKTINEISEGVLLMAGVQSVYKGMLTSKYQVVGSLRTK